MAADDEQRRRAMLEDRFRQSTRNANMGGRLSETSVQTYASKILAAMEVAGYDDPDELVRNPQAAYPKLERHFGGDGRETVATLRGAVSAVLALIKADDRLRYDNRGAAHRAWTAFHRKLVKARDDRLKRSEPTAAQAAKYVGFDEIEKAIKDFEAKPEKLYDVDNFKLHATYLLLNVLTSMTPKRSDLGNVWLITDKRVGKKRLEDLDAQKANYILVQKNVLVLNHLNKVFKKHERVVEQLHPKLKPVLLKSMEVFPRRHLFISAKTWKPYVKPNSYTAFVIRTMERVFGRGAGPSLLRHAYINEKVDFNELSIAEREAIASKMGHEMQMQTMYRWPGFQRERRRLLEAKEANKKKEKKETKKAS